MASLCQICPKFFSQSVIYRQLDEERRPGPHIWTLNVLTTTNGGNYIFPLARSGPTSPPPQPAHSLSPSLPTQMSAAKSEINEDVTLGTISSKLFVTSNLPLQPPSQKPK